MSIIVNKTERKVTIEVNRVGIKGDTGKSAYQSYLDTTTDNPKLTEAEWSERSKGDDGKSAYEVAVENGYVGSETDWLASLKGADGTNGADGQDGAKGDDGDSAYQVWLDAGNTGSVQDFLDSLKGEDGVTTVVGGVPEAPSDGLTRGRKDGAWVEGLDKQEILDLAPLKNGKNIFNKDTVEEGRISGTNGVVVPDSLERYWTSDFIKILPNTQYVISKANIRFIEYDSNKLAIASTYQGTNVTTFTTSASSHFLKITFVKANLDTQQIELGSEVTFYSPYEEFVDSFNNISIRNADKILYDREEIDQINEKINKLIVTLPKTVYAVVGREFNLYYDQFVFTNEYGPDRPNMHFHIACAKGETLDRSYRLTPVIDDVGAYPFILKIYGINDSLIHVSEHTLEVVSNAAITKPSKNIVMVGDSNTSHNYQGNGSPVITQLSANLDDIGGNTPTFLGTHGKTPYRNEGRSGNNMQNIMGGYSLTKLSFTGLSDFYPIIKSIDTDAIYKVDGTGAQYDSSYGFILNSDGSGYFISSRVTTSQTFPLTLIKTTGDAGMPETVIVNAIDQLSLIGSAFRNYTGSGTDIDFTHYRTKSLKLDASEYVDIFTVDMGLNDANNAFYNTRESMKNWFLTYTKQFYDGVIADNPNAKVVFILPKANGAGSTVSLDNTEYRLSHFWVKEAILEEYDENPLNPNAYVSQAGLGIDRWYGYPTGDVNIAARITGTYKANTNALHPNVEGYYQHVDGMTGLVKKLLDE